MQSLWHARPAGGCLSECWCRLRMSCAGATLEWDQGVNFVSDAIGSKLFLRPLLRVRRSHAMSSSGGVNASERV